jgi:SPP1 family predicted phage head-tail adaptor
MIPAGELRERVMFQSFTENTNGDGKVVKTWADVTELWAKVEMLGGTESEEHRQQVGDQRFRITVRYSPLAKAFTDQMRARWCGRFINIGNVRWDEAKTDVIIEGMQRKGTE